ncbi:MAG: hypothetical protein Greene101449_377 [Candidatus Peregrinibacteria bacterium Greene1014_49]|nr:MAG: hypothetical protein Greene101449_377 [Candidatus Peregrinibacteria bacterium Greene1014_49]
MRITLFVSDRVVLLYDCRSLMNITKPITMYINKPIGKSTLRILDLLLAVRNSTAKKMHRLNAKRKAACNVGVLAPKRPKNIIAAPKNIQMPMKTNRWVFIVMKIAESLTRS